MLCKHEKWSPKDHCGFTDPKEYMQHCLRCGTLRFGRDDGERKPKKRERIRLGDK